MASKEHSHATDELNRVGNEHDVALRAGISKGANKGCQEDVGQHKEQFEQRGHPGRSMELGQEGDSRYQESIISKRRKKLRRHNDVKATVHSYNLVITTIKT